MTKLTNRNIPLCRLTLSAANVRTARADPEDDKELQASILSLGILEDLLVIPNGDDNFEVVAGGRRLAACSSSPRPARSPPTASRRAASLAATPTLPRCPSTRTRSVPRCTRPTSTRRTRGCAPRA